MLREHEQLNDLEYRGLYLVQNKMTYTFTMDAVLLANFVKAGARERVLELCAGEGVISILVAAKTKAKEIVGIEIQPVLYDMACRSAAINGLEGRVKFVSDDLKNAAKRFGAGAFDVVVVNPPYKKFDGDPDSATVAEICCSEVLTTLSDVVRSGADALKFGGRFYAVIKADRAGELIALLAGCDIAVKKMVTVFPKAGRKSDTVLIEGRKGGKHVMTIEPLVVFEEDGSYTPALRRIYNK